MSHFSLFVRVVFFGALSLVSLVLGFVVYAAFFMAIDSSKSVPLPLTAWLVTIASVLFLVVSVSLFTHYYRTLKDPVLRTVWIEKRKLERRLAKDAELIITLERK